MIPPAWPIRMKAITPPAKRAGETEPDRGEDPHRIGSRQGKPGQRADDQAAEGEIEDEPENHVSS